MVFSETFPAFITASLKAYWQQFLDACEENHLGPRVPELDDEFLKQLGKTWAGSNFSAQQCLKQPDLVFALHDHPRSLHQSMPHLHDKRLSGLLENAENEEVLMRELRVYRNREMVRIIWRGPEPPGHSRRNYRRSLSHGRCLCQSIAELALQGFLQKSWHAHGSAG